MTYLKHFITSILVSVFILTSVTAQEIDTSQFSMTVDLTPFVVKGIRLADRDPFTTANLDSAAVQRAGTVRDIPYLLNQTPSVHITSDAGAGVGYTDIHIRGTDATRINFTMNGIPMNNDESQGTFFVNHPDLLSSTSSLQIQRGVGSSTNGSGAFGASVNMVNLAQGKKAYAAYGTAVGSYNTYRNSLRAGTGLLKGGYQFDIRLSKITSDGYIERASSDLQSLQLLGGWTSRDERTTVKLHYLTGTQVTGQAWDGVPEHLLESDRRYNALGMMENGEYYSDQTDNYTQDFYQAFVNHKINDNWDGHLALFLTRGKGYYDQYRVNDKFSTYYREPFITEKGDTLSRASLTRQLWLDNYFYGSTFNLNYQKNNTQLNIGGIVSRYDGDHYGYVTWAEYGFPVDYRWYDTPARKDNYSVYAKWRQQFGYRLYLFADLQYRHVDYRMDGFRSNPFVEQSVSYDFLNPKLGLSYSFADKYDNMNKTYASFAVAKKEPNRKDFEISTESVPVPEELYNAELGYQYLAHKWNMGLNAYYMHYRNQLVLTGKINDVGAYTRQNVPESYRRGIELTAAYNPIKALAFSGNMSLSQNKIVDFHEFIDDYDNGGQIENVYELTDIALSPAIIAYAQLTVKPFAERLENLYIDIIGKHVGRQYLDNTTNIARSLDPYTLADLRIGYSVELPRVEELGLSLSLNNLFNRKYESNGYTFSYLYGGEMITENYYFPQAGFNFILGLDVKF